MKRVLSIDWDYFINATAEQRYTLFPDGGNENISTELQEFIWNSRYSVSPELKKISVLKRDYNLIYDILLKFARRRSLSREILPYHEVFVAISHRWAYDFVRHCTKERETFEVYNIDFHHDMYNLNGGTEVNCGNWVNRLSEKRPNMKYFWVKREDSDTELPIGHRPPCEIKSIEDLKDLDFDCIFLCRSDCWSPPHLDVYFDVFWALLHKYMPVILDNQVKKCRRVDTLSEIEQRYGAELALAKGMRKYPNATCANCGAIIPEGSSSIFCNECNQE